MSKYSIDEQYKKNYNKLTILTSGQRNRLRRRTKNNYDRIRKEIITYKEKYGIICIYPTTSLIYKIYNDLCEKLKYTTKDLVIIDKII